jgi:hypothetical protein
MPKRYGGRKAGIEPAAIAFLLFFAINAGAQPADSLSGKRLHLLEPADSLHKGRFWTCAAGGAAIYGVAAAGLYQAWYKDYELIGFHTFNDWAEWKDMDKMGHFITTYTECRLVYNGARWTGMRRRPALWTGVAVGAFLQATVEVMDGFSAKWGFSWADMGFNTAGLTLFAAQELAWQEQRIVAKISYTRPNYPNEFAYTLGGPPPMTVAQRARELYGVSFAESFLKDYNALSIWASVNLHAFVSPRRPDTRLPKWLNIAVGYGAENLYGGFKNEWTDAAGNLNFLPEDEYPRYRQFFISPDIDFTRIPTRSRVLKTVFSALNFIKIPAPALEINTRGKVKGYWFYW